MVNRCSLDEKLIEKEISIVLNEVEDVRKFVKYFVNLMEGILNYEYDELKSYFENGKTAAEIRFIKKRYESKVAASGMFNCWISARIELYREGLFSYPKLKVVEFKVADKFYNYTMNIDHFINGSVEDEKFITDYLKIIRSQIFKDFKHDWSYNKNKIFKRYVKNKKFTPSQYIIACINNYIYDDIIKPKSKILTYDEFLNSEFKFEVDKKTRRIFDKYFFDNI